jgi:hypothetical protein
VIVPCLVGLYSQDIIQALVKFLQWYETTCRTKEYTKETLKKLALLMQE